MNFFPQLVKSRFYLISTFVCRYQLKECRVPLPPRILVVLWPHGRHHAVQVRDDVCGLCCSQGLKMCHVHLKYHMMKYAVMFHCKPPSITLRLWCFICYHTLNLVFTFQFSFLNFFGLCTPLFIARKQCYC